MTETEKGVAWAAPPSHLFAEASALVDQMTAQLPADVQGAVIGIATAQGWNAAVVHRVGESFTVASWIGKSWHSELTGGAAVRVVW